MWPRDVDDEHVTKIRSSCGYDKSKRSTEKKLNPSAMNTDTGRTKRMATETNKSAITDHVAKENRTSVAITCVYAYMYMCVMCIHKYECMHCIILYFVELVRSLLVLCCWIKWMSLNWSSAKILDRVSHQKARQLRESIRKEVNCVNKDGGSLQPTYDLWPYFGHVLIVNVTWPYAWWK